MVESVANGSGDSGGSVRGAIIRRGMVQLGLAQSDTDIPAELAHYVDTAARYAPDISDRDVQELLAAGWSEAEILEITVAASVAAG